ncbi:MAG: hypothetical protein ACYTGB_19920, partial [Planctomycetota bacterium]
MTYNVSDFDRGTTLKINFFGKIPDGRKMLELATTPDLQPIFRRETRFVIEVLNAMSEGDIRSLYNSLEIPAVGDSKLDNPVTLDEIKNTLVRYYEGQDAGLLGRNAITGLVFDDLDRLEGQGDIGTIEFDREGMINAIMGPYRGAEGVRDPDLIHRLEEYGLKQQMLPADLGDYVLRELQARHPAVEKLSWHRAPGRSVGRESVYERGYEIPKPAPVEMVTESTLTTEDYYTPDGVLRHEYSDSQGTESLSWLDSPIRTAEETYPLRNPDILQRGYRPVPLPPNLNVTDLTGRWLQDLVNTYERQGVIPKAGGAINEQASVALEAASRRGAIAMPDAQKRFAAKMPKLIEAAEVIRLLTDQNTPSFVIAAMHMYAGGVQTGHVPEAMQYALRQLENNPRFTVQVVNDALTELHLKTQETLKSRRIGPYVLAFRAGAVDPEAQLTSVTLDPRVALVHQSGNYGMLGEPSLKVLAEGFKEYARPALAEALDVERAGGVGGQFQAFLIPVEAIQYDVDLAHNEIKSPLLSELLVPPQALQGPIEAVELPLKNLKQVVPFVPGSWRKLSALQRARVSLNKATAKLNNMGIPVVSVARERQIQLEFTANPLSGEVIARLGPAAKAGDDVMAMARTAFEQEMEKGEEGAPLEALRQMLLGTKRAQKLIHKKVQKAGKEINWLRNVVNWAQADPETRGAPPAAPKYIDDPLKWLGAIRQMYGSHYESTLFAVENVLGSKSAGRTALYGDDPNMVEDAVREAV